MRQSFEVALDDQAGVYVRIVVDVDPRTYGQTDPRPLLDRAVAKVKAAMEGAA
jgi:hypothetical protein